VNDAYGKNEPDLTITVDIGLGNLTLLEE
jgi:hypothetical protein